MRTRASFTSGIMAIPQPVPSGLPMLVGIQIIGDEIVIASTTDVADSLSGTAI